MKMVCHVPECVCDERIYSHSCSCNDSNNVNHELSTDVNLQNVKMNPPMAKHFCVMHLHLHTLDSWQSAFKSIKIHFILEDEISFSLSRSLFVFVREPHLAESLYEYERICSSVCRNERTHSNNKIFIIPTNSDTNCTHRNVSWVCDAPALFVQRIKMAAIQWQRAGEMIPKACCYTCFSHY